jgi:hypothetical protein
LLNLYARGAALKFARAELSYFKGITIYMHTDTNSKHEAPHFHAKYEYDYDVFDVSYGIKLLNKIAGDFPKDKEKLVLKWAQVHLDKLQQNWDFLINEKPPKRIQPLKKLESYKGKKYNPYHKIIGFVIVDDYLIKIFFNDGFSRVVNFYPLLKGAWYGQLLDLNLFNKVFITHGHGNLYWPNDVEFSSKDLYHWDRTEQGYLDWTSTFK